MHFQLAIVAENAICSRGRVEHSLAAFTRLSRRVTRPGVYARVKTHQNRKARFNGLMPLGFSRDA
jgi:hypothetical protein